MSHFTCMVISRPGENPEEQLEPFSEHIVYDRYVSATKQDLIEKKKKDIEWTRKNSYEPWLKDKAAYEAECRNERHLEYLENEFPKLLEATDEELYQEVIQYYEPEEIGPNGEVYSTYNPNSKWDWYQLGGRWSGLIKLKPHLPDFDDFQTNDGEDRRGVIGCPGSFNNKVGIDRAKKGDIANLDEIGTFAVLKDGEWYERGEMGWCAVVSNEKEEEQWDAEQKSLIESLPDDTIISIYDCHI